MMRNRTTVFLAAGLLAAALALGVVGGTLAQTMPMAPDATHANCQQGALYDAVAQALGISTDELYTAQTAGKTVAQLAAERGVDLDTVTAAALQAHKQGLEAQVQVGRLTREQADLMQTQMTAHLGAMFSGQFGPMMMGPGGMMGTGMTMGSGGMMGAGMMGPGHMSGPGHMMAPGQGPQR
jgi:hypothetical protein